MCTSTEFDITGQGVSALTSGVSSYYSARAERSALRAQASLSDIRARLMESNAQDAIRRGNVDEQKIRLDNARLKSEQRVAYAANNIALDSGSVTAMLTDADLSTEIDVNTVQMNALNEAFGYRREALSAATDSRNTNLAARGISPTSAGFTTLLTGAKKVATARADAQTAGLINKGDSFYVPPPSQKPTPRRGRNA